MSRSEKGFVVVADDVGQVHEHVTSNECSWSFGSWFTGSEKSHDGFSLSLEVFLQCDTVIAYSQ
jgi:hypothetical protein